MAVRVAVLARGTGWSVGGAIVPLECAERVAECPAGHDEGTGGVACAAASAVATPVLPANGVLAGLPKPPAPSGAAVETSAGGGAIAPRGGAAPEDTSVGATAGGGRRGSGCADGGGSGGGVGGSSKESKMLSRLAARAESDVLVRSPSAAGGGKRVVGSDGDAEEASAALLG